MDYNEYLDILQENVIHYLEKGLNPWQSPWKTAANGESKRPYHGLNALLLTTVAARKYDGDCRYYTFQQAKNMGSPVKKGEHGWPAILIKPQYAFQPELDEDGNPLLDADGKVKLERVSIPPVFQLHVVFNAKQLDNPPEYDPQEYKEAEFDEEAARRIVGESPASIKHDQIAEAYYSDADDMIHVPQRESFRGDLEYFNTVFHEMVHSTGTAKRLNRDSLKYYHYRKDWRAKEELVAEIGAVMLADKVGLKYVNSSSAAYIKSWANAIKSGDINFKEFYPEVSKAIHYITHPENRQRMHETAMHVEDGSKAYISDDRCRVIFIQKGDGDYYDWTIYEADPKKNILIREIDGGQLDGASSMLKTFDAIKDERTYALMPLDYFHMLEEEYQAKEIEAFKAEKFEAEIKTKAGALAKYATPYYRDPTSPVYEKENEAKAEMYYELLNDLRRINEPKGQPGLTDESVDVRQEPHENKNIANPSYRRKR